MASGRIQQEVQFRCQELLVCGGAVAARPSEGMLYELMEDDRFIAAVSQQRPSKAFATMVRSNLKLLGKVRKVWAIGAYPQSVKSTLNRTYPGNQYEIEQLQPVHLQRREARAVDNAVD